MPTLRIVLFTALDRLGSMFGHDVVANRTVENYFRAEWPTNPFTRGTISYARVGETTCSYQLYIRHFEKKNNQRRNEKIVGK